MRTLQKTKIVALRTLQKTKIVRYAIVNCVNKTMLGFVSLHPTYTLTEMHPNTSISLKRLLLTR